MDQGAPHLLGLPGLIAGLNEEGGRIHGFCIRDVRMCTKVGFFGGSGGCGGYPLLGLEAA